MSKSVPAHQAADLFEIASSEINSRGHLKDKLICSHGYTAKLNPFIAVRCHKNVSGFITAGEEGR